MSATRRELETAATLLAGPGRLGGRRRFRPYAARTGGLAALIALWYRRWEQRAALAALDDHLLRDIGKTRRQALAEAGKPFWRP